MTMVLPNDELAPIQGKTSISDGLGIDTLQCIASRATRESFTTGQILFFEEDPGDALYIVEKGSVEISVMSANGKKLSLNVVRESEVFGEIAVLDGGSRTATAMILEPSTLLRVTRNDLLHLLREHAEVSRALLSLLCDRVRWTSRLAGDLGLLGIRERLASRLLILYRKFSDEHGELPLCQTELADFLGATRESTNKVLRNWQQEGLVELTRGTVRILDPKRLMRIATSGRG